MTSREQLAEIVARTRAELIERGVIKNANGMRICTACKKEAKQLFQGKCAGCDKK